MRIAVDNQVSKDCIDELNKIHEVVLCANDMMDEQWIELAIDLEVDLIISPDLDVPNYLDRMNSNIRWIDLPQNLGSNKQFKFLMKAIKRINISA